MPFRKVDNDRETLAVLEPEHDNPFGVAVLSHDYYWQIAGSLRVALGLAKKLERANLGVPLDFNGNRRVNRKIRVASCTAILRAAASRNS
jgi:hypothetical protein